MTHNLADLRRPRLLIRAARFGLAAYRRDRDLRRLLHNAVTPGPAAALTQLVEMEEHLEGARTTRSEGYSTAHHVAVLTALMAEAQSAVVQPQLETKAA